MSTAGNSFTTVVKATALAGQMSTAGNSFTTVVKATALQVRCPQQATPLPLK
jgi:hypothetical protein